MLSLAPFDEAIMNDNRVTHLAFVMALAACVSCAPMGRKGGAVRSWEALPMRCDAVLNEPADPLAAVKSSCSSDGSVCIRAEQTVEGPTFYVENYNYSNIALSFGMKGANNLSYRGRMPAGGTRYLIMNVSPCSSTLVTRMKVSNPNVKWLYEYRFDFNRGKLDAVHRAPAKYVLPVKGGRYFDWDDFEGSNSAVRIAASAGSTVTAAREGRVVYVYPNQASHQMGFPNDEVGRISVEHVDGTIADYYFVTSSVVRPGMEVKRGTELGVVAHSFGSYEPYVHFQVTRQRDDGVGHAHSEYVSFAMEGVPARRGISAAEYRRRNDLNRSGGYRPVEPDKSIFTSIEQFPLPKGAKITYKNLPLKGNSASLWFNTSSSLSSLRNFYLDYFEKRGCEVSEDIDKVEKGEFILSFECTPSYRADVRIMASDQAHRSSVDKRSVGADFRVAR